MSDEGGLSSRIRRFAESAEAFAAMCDPDPWASQFTFEWEELDRDDTVEEPGVLWALHEDVIVQLGAMTAMLRGVADLVWAAEARTSECGTEMNGFALAAAVRPIVEVSAQAAHLLDPRVDAAERGRRYMVWRCEELRTARQVFARLGSIPERVAELDQVEAELERFAVALGLRWRSSTVGGATQGSAARILDEDRKVQGHPSITALVGDAFGMGPELYSLLSQVPHGSRLGIRSTVGPTGAPSARPPSHPLGLGAAGTLQLAVHAVFQTVGAVAMWCAVEPAEPTHLAVPLLHDLSAPRIDRRPAADP